MENLRDNMKCYLNIRRYIPEATMERAKSGYLWDMGSGISRGGGEDYGEFLSLTKLLDFLKPHACPSNFPGLL